MIVISTLLELDSLVEMLPIPSTFFISCKVLSFTFFLFIIVVFVVVFVLPVLVTLYPSFSSSFTTACSVLFFPLPFNTSIFIYF